MLMMLMMFTFGRGWELSFPPPAGASSSLRVVNIVKVIVGVTVVKVFFL